MCRQHHILPPSLPRLLPKESQRPLTMTLMRFAQLRKRITMLEASNAEVNLLAQKVQDLQTKVKSGVFCYRCGQDGHVAYDCDNPPNKSLVEEKYATRRGRRRPMTGKTWIRPDRRLLPEARDKYGHLIWRYGRRDTRNRCKNLKHTMHSSFGHWFTNYYSLKIISPKQSFTYFSSKLPKLTTDRRRWVEMYFHISDL